MEVEFRDIIFSILNNLLKGDSFIRLGFVIKCRECARERPTKCFEDHFIKCLLFKWKINIVYVLKCIKGILFILINNSKSTFILIKKTFCDILFQNNFFFSYGNIHIYKQIIFIVRHIWINIKIIMTSL